MKEYDYIIIGTSPLALAEAIYWKRKGFSVLNVDEGSEIGGAWRTVKYEGFPEVEIGCHIWSIHEEAYSWMRAFLGVDLVRLTPQPRIFYRSFNVPYDWKTNVLFLKKAGKQLASFNAKFFGELKKYPDMRFSIVPEKYLYPKGGAMDIKKALLRRVTQENLEVLLNTKINEIAIQKKGVTCLTSTEEMITATKELVVTSLFNVGQIQNHETTFFLDQKRVEYIHYHLIIRGQKMKPFSYIRCMGNDLIHRISDMTSQVKDQLNVDEQLISVGVFEKAFHAMSDPARIQRIKTYLIEKKIIHRDAQILKSDFNIFPSFYSDSETITKIADDSEGKLRFLRSTDFIYGFVNQLDRYKSLFTSNTR